MEDGHQQQGHTIRCSFCNRSKAEVKRLVLGRGTYICSDCILLASEVLFGGDEHGLAEPELVAVEEPSVCVGPFLRPTEIKARLDEYVISQDLAKKVLSVAVYNHYKRLLNNVAESPRIGKSNVLLLGPTGTGKTLLAKTLARALDVPFACTDATTITETGYIGDDVENVLRALLCAADWDTEKAERGIIYIDEIDKISRRSESTSVTRDVSGEGVQQALLKIMEGTQSRIPPNGGRKHPEEECIELDTSNILFICGGAFEGLSDIIGRRVGKNSVGFAATQKTGCDNHAANLLDEVQPNDLMGASAERGQW